MGRSADALNPATDALNPSTDVLNPSTEVKQTKSFYNCFWWFFSVENMILNISSPILGVALSFMIPEGLKQDQKMNWR